MKIRIVIIFCLLIFLLSISVNAEEGLKISDLPELLYPFSIDIFPIVNSGQTKKIQLGNLFRSDSVQLGLGLNLDLLLFHDGINSYIKNNTGDFFIKNVSYGSEIKFTATNSAGTPIDFFTLSPDTPALQLLGNIALNGKYLSGDGGNEGIFIDAAGNVGIGTTVPGYPLEVERTGENAAIVADRTGGATSYMNATDSFTNVGSISNHPLRLVVNSAVAMTIDTNGNVGIGTETPAAELELENSGNNAVMQIERTDGVTGIVSAREEEMHIGTSSAHSVQVVANNNPVMTLAADGNVGIGTGTPEYPLELETTGENAHIQLDRTDGVQVKLNATSALGQVGTHSNHPFNIVTGNTSRMTIDETGNVGIGTTTPAYDMELETTGVAGVFAIDRTDGATAKMAAASNQVQFGSISNHPTNILVNNSTAMTVTTDGKVGIGTMAPGYKFEIETTGEDASVYLDRTDGAQIRLEAMDAKGVIGTKSAHRLNLNTNNIPRMTIDENGNVGIGTTTPGYQLELETTGIGAQIVAERTDGATAKMVAGEHSAQFGSISNHPVNIMINDATKAMTIGTNGYVGIGTETPGYPMHLQTTGTNAEFLTEQTGGAQAQMGAASSLAYFGARSNHETRFQVNSTWRMRLNTTANSKILEMVDLGYYDGTWNGSSSREVKENIETLTTDEAVNALEELSPVKFNYKKNKEEEHVGFIAEDVPDLVATKERKALSAMDVVAVLTKVVKEQQKTISQLNKRITELEKGKPRNR